MAGIIWTPGERTAQPVSVPSINRASSLSVGILDSLLFLPSGTPVNVSRPYISVNKTGTPVPEKTVKGNASYLSAGASWDIASTTNYAAGDFSVYCLVLFRAFGSYATLIDKNNGAGFRELAFFLDTSGNINYIGIGGVNNTDSVSLGLSLNVFYDIVITRVGSTVSFYVNGVFKGNPTLPYSGTTGSSNPLVLARNSSGGGVNTNAVFASFSTWSRALRANEVAELYVNPWQLFEADNDPVFYSLAAGGTTVAVPAGALTLTGYAPTVSFTAHQTIAAPAGALTLTGFAPTVSTSAAQTIAVPAGALTLTGFAPTVAATAHQTISVPAGSLTLTTYAPTVYTTAVTTIAVPAGTLTLTGYAPTVSYTTHAYIGVPAGALTLTGYAPTVTGGESSIWTPASASSGTWTPASASGGTWTPQ